MVSMLQALLLGLPLAVLFTKNPEARLFTYSGIIFLISMSLLLLIFVPKMIIVVQNKNAKSRERISTSGTIGMRINMAGVINPGCPADSYKASQFNAQASSEMIIAVQDKNAKSRERISTSGSIARMNMAGVVNLDRPADSNTDTPFHAQADASVPSISELADNRQRETDRPR
jgi:hypothetical protein